MARVFLVLFLLAFSIYTLIDCCRTEREQIPGKISKPLWVIFIAVVPLIGPAGWMLMKYRDLLSSSNPLNSAGGYGAKWGNGNAPETPAAPDDDPDFLARLEARNRRRAYEQRKSTEKPQKREEKNNGTEDEDDTSRGLYG